MIDPWIMDNPKTPPELKDLGKLGKVDVIFVTHAHGDHLGDSIPLAKKNDAPVWGPAGMDQFLATLGILPAKLAPRFGKGGTIEPVPGLKVTAVHAEHSSEMILKDPATGKDIQLSGRRAGRLHLPVRQRLHHLPHGRHRRCSAT